ncbi:MAG: cytochrome C [Piscinibacter sp.]|uniref:cytochrome C n=1 Tax=Piscinibacter sp. TaxID=1903157 RepID=UPI00258B10DF|nr:cytochrome C [Piscinibacter sp.]MCW5662541.1 cytochrome C [Piscinibacter sp.]
MRVLVVIASLLGTLAAPGAAAQGPADAASAPPTHRPLRDNRPATGPQPAPPEKFAGIAGAPAYTVVPRTPALALYPCSQCHKLLPLNPQPRQLDAAPHNAALRHGGGRFWCLDCHTAKDRDQLHAIDGTPVGFDQSDRLCGQCHGPRQRDWAFGGHGKRVGRWQGERRIYACTHCHDPHQPQLAPRAPAPPPPVRAGLQPTPTVHSTPTKPWQRQEGKPHE